MINLNIYPMKGTRDSYPKSIAGSRLPNWKQAQREMYKGVIEKNRNTIMITGVLPYNESLQIIVLDFDGKDHEKISWDTMADILIDFGKKNFNPYIVRQSGNGGFHFVFICDSDFLWTNTQKRGLRKEVKSRWSNEVDDIDVRANGGLVYWDCKFTDTDRYITIFQEDNPDLVSSKKLYEFVEVLLNPRGSSYSPITLTGGTSPSKIITPKPVAKKVTINNYKDFDIPEGKYYSYCLLKDAVKDMWTGSYIIERNDIEYKIWALFWRELLSRGFTESEVMARLSSGIQPEYEREETIQQLKYLKFIDRVPTVKYYESLFPEYGGL